MIRCVPCLLMALLAGCDAIGIVVPRDTRVRLINDGEFVVEGQVTFDDEQDIPEELLEEVGSEIDFSLSPGETRLITRDCDDLQAIKIEQADLVLVGEIGPETESNVLRDGDDFGCGDTITFRFSHSPLIVDFDVSVSVSSSN